MFFGRKDKLLVDMHSHLIPGIDDGSKSFDYTVQLIRAMRQIGFRKLITTPHIHPKYPNKEGDIVRAFDQLKEDLANESLDMELDVAAEYFVDDVFLEKLSQDKPLLTFGDNYLLIECSFTSKPYFIEDTIFKLKSAGYTPVFAHPERYRFLNGEVGWLKTLKASGLLMQVTLGSFAGFYGRSCKKFAQELYQHNMIDFLASDIHNKSYLSSLQAGLNTHAAQKLLKGSRLLNQTLL